MSEEPLDKITASSSYKTPQNCQEGLTLDT